MCCACEGQSCGLQKGGTGGARTAEFEARRLGLEIVGFYHSHPDHPAKPSDYDRDHALPFYSYIILRVAEGRPELMTSWRLRISREAFDPEQYEIEP